MSDSASATNDATLTPLYHGAQNHCFGCGQANSVGLHLNFAVAPDHTVACDAVVSDNYEGPPGYLHGGIIATLLDEAMSKANRAHGVTAMTRQMQVEYLRPVPSQMPIRIEGGVTRSEGRKHWTTARILNAEGVILAHASALFIAVSVRK
ncbi:MAG TPA: PaaI family thioesterase [Acidobacteriaceae bacterium]